MSMACRPRGMAAATAACLLATLHVGAAARVAPRPRAIWRPGAPAHAAPHIALPRKPALGELLGDEPPHNVSAALMAEWQALLAPANLSVLVVGVGTCALAAHSRSLPFAVWAGGCAHALSQRYLQKREPPGAVTEEEMLVAAHATLAGLGRAITLLLAAATLLASSAAISTYLGAAVLSTHARRWARRRRARRLQAGVRLEPPSGAPAPPPPPPSGSLSPPPRAPHRARLLAHTRACGAQLLAFCQLAALELVWALRPMGTAVLFGAQRLRVWLPRAISFLISVEWAQTFEAASTGVRDFASGFGGALSGVPQGIAYQANIRGLQFENFLASSWSSWLQLRAKWLRSSKYKKRRRGGKKQKNDLAQAIEYAMQSTITGAKSGWVRWQLQAAQQKASQQRGPAARAPGAAGAGKSGSVAKLSTTSTAKHRTGAAAGAPTPPGGSAGLRGSSRAAAAVPAASRAAERAAAAKPAAEASGLSQGIPPLPRPRAVVTNQYAPSAAAGKGKGAPKPAMRPIDVVAAFSPKSKPGAQHGAEQQRTAHFWEAWVPRMASKPKKEAPAVVDIEALSVPVPVPAPSERAAREHAGADEGSAAAPQRAEPEGADVVEGDGDSV